MNSWVYLFSKFTPEVLLFEALIIFVLTGGYAGFWILRRRRMGTMQDTVPVGVFKHYLNQVVSNAENIHGQLFGTLEPGAYTGGPNIPVIPVGVGQVDAALAQRLSLVEAQVAEKEKAYQTIIIEKQKLEKDLSDARTAKSSSSGIDMNAESEAMIRNLQEKIQSLEERLAEYSVIEDDLANLKKLQQENSQLRGILAKKGVSPADVGPSQGQSQSQTKVGPAVTSVPPVQASAAGVQAAPVEPIQDVVSAFEGIVDNVEDVLNTSTQAVPQEVAVAQLPPQQSSPSPQLPSPQSSQVQPQQAQEKSDADLVAEFEKMLKG